MLNNCTVLLLNALGHRHSNITVSLRVHFCYGSTDFWQN